jgi:hypothetical protein
MQRMFMRFAHIAALSILLPGCGIQPDRVSREPLAKHPGADIFGFDKLPPLRSKGGDAIRVLVQPSFGRYHYRFDFVPLEKACTVPDSNIDDLSDDKRSWCGAVTVNGERTTLGASDGEQQNSEALPFRFVVPAEDFRSFFNVLKHRMARWNGSRSQLLDGTSVAIEQHARGEVRSYHSNAIFEFSQDNPAAFASLFVRSLALAYGPSGIFPRSEGWHVRSDEQQIELRFACNAQFLNTADPDGIGVGDDRCATALKQGIAR